MKAIRRIWQDIRNGQNIDIYITVTVSFVVAILSAFGVTNQTLISSAILAILALVSASLLSNRRANESIESALRAVEKSIGSSVSFLNEERSLLTKDFTEKAVSADKIDIITLSMQAVLEGA